MSNKYDAVFDQVESTPDMGGFIPNLPIGRHKVALWVYRVKDAKKREGEVIMEAEFMVMESTDKELNEGDMRGWAWWPSGTSWSAKYNRDRARKFTLACQQCIGDQSQVSAFGKYMSGKEQPLRGLVLVVEIYKKMENGKPMLSKTSGKEITEVSWTPQAQSPADIAEIRRVMAETRGDDADLDDVAPSDQQQTQQQSAPPPAQTQQAAPPPAQTQAQPTLPAGAQQVTPKKPSIFGKRQ